MPSYRHAATWLPSVPNPMQVPHPHALLHLPVFRGPGDGAQIQGAGNDHSELYANLFTRYYDAHITFGLFVPIHALLRRPPTVLPSPCPLSATHTLLRRSRTVLPSPRPLSVTLPALSPSPSASCATACTTPTTSSAPRGGWCACCTRRPPACCGGANRYPGQHPARVTACTAHAHLC